MICGSCPKPYEGGPGDPCPHCGARHREAPPDFIKTSTILISTGGGESVYRSLEEIPAPLRSELLKSTNSADSGTILIADRKGREEIARAVRRLPAGLPLGGSLPGSPAPEASEAAATGRHRLWTALAGTLLLLAVLLAWAVWVGR
jgi:hypothetical protein